MPKDIKSKMNMAFRSDSFDEDAHTVDVVYATDTPVGRGQFREILEISADAIDAERLDAGTVHLIRDHMPFGDHFGRVIGHRLENGQAIATVQLSEADDKKGVVDDIRSGVIRSVSVGYLISAYDEVEGDDGVTVRTVTRWMPYEISLTPIPADVNAAFRSDADLTADEPAPAPQETHAPPATTEAQEDAANNDAAAETQTENEAPNVENEDQNTAVEQERSRVKSIRGLAKRHGLGDEFVDTHIDSGAEVDAVRSAALDAIASRSTPEVNGARTRIVRDEQETLAQRTEEALMNRFAGEELTDAGRDLRGLTLAEMARNFVPNGSGMSSAKAVAAAMSQRGMHSTSDFPVILGNVANKTMSNAYERVQRTYKSFVREVENSDLKPVTRTHIGDGSALLPVEEGGEYKHGTMSESAESYKLEKYGRKLAITEEAIINDDMDVFSRLPEKIGRQAAETEANLVYDILNKNPKMFDGKALFHSAHGNLLSASALDVAAIAAARAAGRKQTDQDGNPINILLKTLIVNEDNEFEAEQILKNITPNSSDQVNPFVNKLQLAVDPRVKAGSFFLAADYAQTDTIELAYLSGARGLQTEMRAGFDVDGIEIKAKLYVAAKAIDWRGLIRGDLVAAGSD